MASTTTSGAPHKTVIGYPAQSSQVAAGYPAAGTAYPYAAPPPPSYSQAYRPVVSPTGSISPSFLRRMIVAGAAIFAIIGLLFFIAWIVFRPRLPEFRVESASVSQLNMTRSELTATWNLTLFVRNRNTKLNIYYDRVQALVIYGDGSQLGEIPLPPFYQAKKNETWVQFAVGVVDEYVGEGVVTKIAGERTGGSVGFGVTVFAWVKFTTGSWWRTRYSLLRVYCDRVKFGLTPNTGSGSMSGQPRACEVEL